MTPMTQMIADGSSTYEIAERNEPGRTDRLVSRVQGRV
jgi:hypothetical protein